MNSTTTNASVTRSTTATTMTLQNKILWFVASILILVAALVSVTTLQSAYQHSNQQLQERFETAKQVLTYKLQNDSQVLRSSLENVVKDFNLKQLVASGAEDPESLRVAMINQQRRTDASFTLVFDQAQTIMMSTQTAIDSSTIGSVADYTDERLHLQAIDGRLYLIAAVGMKFLEQQPGYDNWILMGIDLAHLIDSSVVQLTGFNVDVFHQQAHLLSAAEDSTTQLTTLPSTNHESSRHLMVDEKDYIAYQFTLEASSPIHFVFTIANQSAFLDFFELAFQLIFEIVIALIAALLLSVYLSRNITKPLRALASVARRIQQGDYQSPIPNFSTEEVKQLSQAFRGMQDGIQEREREINQLAYYDSLTDLPNRNSFIRELQRKVEQGSSETLAVLMFDLDRFKDINDTIGHHFGDLLLKQIACRMEALRLANAFYARVGGDEFTILLSNVAPEEIPPLAQQCIQLFDRPFTIEGIHLDVDASFGLAIYPNHSDSAYGMMQCADIALYKAKGTHHKLIEYDVEFDTLSVQRLNLMSELRKAIEENQLQLYYQPKLCLQTDTVISVECLVRWIHPEYGFISPDDFIPLAEQTGAIRDLTYWAIETALQQHVEWRNSGIALRFAVNISAVDLVDLSLPAYVAEHLDRYKVDSSHLALEVTESALMDDPDAAIKALRMLQRMGISLSIDDFGTGYSSMAYLKQMPVSELKIDKAFVLELATNKDDEKIVKSTVDLAHNLGLSVVAEGVEDEAALSLLRHYQVEYAQGYHIARPMKAEDFLGWIANSSYQTVAQG
ncbi:MAG: GGDEF domain-containing protein [Cellvibrionaceae bacterium]|nr:GGDEF domain-containing protein [Cellvibrionaceae bacterium]